MGPYRESAVYEIYKEKEAYKMPKAFRVFLYLLPALVMNIISGIVVDKMAVGNYTKAGLLLTLILLNLFCISATIAEAEKFSKY